MQYAAPDLYMNMQQFADLRLQARKDSPEAAKTVAQQFEGLFIQQMLKSMRSAATLDPGQHSSTLDFYTDMYDKQLSQVMAQRGGIGIADMLQQQLGAGAEKRQQPAAGTGLELPQYRQLQTTVVKSAVPLDSMTYRATNPQVQAHPLNSPAQSDAASTVVAASKPALQVESIQPFEGWNNASEFVADLWPHAEKAAARLGVSAQVLVAQSALETGWGRHAMRKPDGHVAFNLFGIKAQHDWNGQVVSHNTLEFRQGAMQQEQARFRAYDTVAESLDDYVDFVQNRGRYDAALQHGGSDEKYIRELHRAGYATDPAYADKILNIMQGETFREAVASLGISPTVVS